MGRAAELVYRTRATQQRQMYHRLHQEVDGPLERVRAAVVAGSADAVPVRTADHGDLLGAHGGLQQKWCSLYDESTRVPLWIARTGTTSTEPRRVDAPTSHVDLVPTLLAAAGIDERAIAVALGHRFSEVHPFPGRNLVPVVDGAPADEDRPVYLQTRDNVFEGDAQASALATRLGLADRPPPLLRCRPLTGVPTNLEGIVARVPAEVSGTTGDHLWKLVRTFDDPAASGRAQPLEDEWELYDLSVDPDELDNQAHRAASSATFDHLVAVLRRERLTLVPRRNEPWS